MQYIYFIEKSRTEIFNKEVVGLVWRSEELLGECNESPDLELAHFGCFQEPIEHEE